MDFTTEIKRLQKLSCIALSHEEEQKLGMQLKKIIDFLGQLPETKGTINNQQETVKDKLKLRTIAGVKEDINYKKIMNNVKHEVVNNSIVIKSVLS